MAEVSTAPVGMEEISQLIRLKERELHEIHDMRCANLEKLVEDREHLVAEATKRFEQLKEDFSYNLVLLGARDEEINRLEGELSEKSEALDKSEGERRSLVSKVEVLELRDTERAEKHVHEKNNSKRILQELKDVIESMKWAAAEETKAKSREIDVLRDDNRLLAASREESLESQRRDLTSTFEQLIVHRENHYNAREKKLGAKVLAMDGRLEEMGTENSRLTSELHSAQRAAEAREKDFLQSKEKIQNLQWQIEDERGSNQRSIDALERQVQALNAEILSVRDSSEQEVTDLKGALEATKQDVEREKDFREILEKRLSDFRDTSKTGASHLEAEVRARTASEARLKSELLRITADYENLLVTIEHSKMEAAAGLRRSESLQEDLESKTVELDKTRQLLAEKQDELSLANLTVRKTAEKEQALLDKISELEAAMEQASREAVAHQDAGDTAQSRIVALEALLQEEKAEGEALQLRIRLQESQLHALKSDSNKTAEVDGISLHKTPAAALIEGRKQPDGATRGTLGLGIDQAEVASPIFSEDFGPVSLPASPLATPNPNPAYTGSLKASDEGGFSLRDSLPPPRTHSASVETHPTAADAGLGLGLGLAANTTKSQYDVVNQGLVEENNRLKQVVKEMRADVESLQQQVLNQSQSPGAAGGAAVASAALPEDYEDLQKRLEKTTAEVVRLKAERKTLMDIGNELRSALNREYRNEIVAPGAAPGSGLPPTPPSLPQQQHSHPALLRSHYHQHHQHHQQQQQQQQHVRGTGPMYFNYDYDASAIATARHYHQEETRRTAAAGQPPLDAIAMINAFEGDMPDHHQQTSDNVSGIGVRGRGVPNTGAGYNRGYGATAGRTGVNTHGKYGGHSNSTAGGDNSKTMSKSTRPPTANATTRAASAQARSQPRKIMNYARGAAEDRKEE